MLARFDVIPARSLYYGTVLFLDLVVRFVSFLVGTSLLNDNSVLCSTVHRDIKPSNILVVENKKKEAVIKLSDFGMSKEVQGAKQPRMTAGVGTPGWRSPEVVKGQRNINVSILSTITLHNLT